MMSKKELVSFRTYNPHSLTSTGYDWTLYEDGHLSCTSRSRWQGDRDNARYVTKPQFVDVRQIDDADPDNDAEATITQLAHSLCPSTDPGFRQTRRGVLVQ